MYARVADDVEFAAQQKYTNITKTNASGCRSDAGHSISPGHKLLNFNSWHCVTEGGRRDEIGDREREGGGEQDTRPTMLATFLFHYAYEEGTCASATPLHIFNPKPFANR